GDEALLHAAQTPTWVARDRLAGARAAARALVDETDLDAEAIVRKAMAVAGSICIYTNDNLTIETIKVDD
ncbi:MAG: hypothetical protein AAFR20_11800, partial [Pseudomonadota bacterium]